MADEAVMTQFRQLDARVDELCAIEANDPTPANQAARRAAYDEYTAFQVKHGLSYKDLASAAPVARPAPALPERRAPALLDHITREAEKLGAYDLELVTPLIAAESQVPIGKQLRNLRVDRPDLFRGDVPFAPREAYEQFMRLVQEGRHKDATAFAEKHRDAIAVAAKQVAKEQDEAAQRERQRRSAQFTAAFDAQRLRVDVAAQEGRIDELERELLGVRQGRKAGSNPKEIEKLLETERKKLGELKERLKDATARSTDATAHSRNRTAWGLP